jgi:hypothetical protein
MHPLFAKSEPIPAIISEKNSELFANVQAKAAADLFY